MLSLSNIIKKIKLRWAKRSSRAYIDYLRSMGMSIGEGVHIVDPHRFDIDITRPSLITIGNHVRFNKHTTVMCHDAACMVVLRKYGKVIPNNGHITIGNNVWFGRYASVLKGVSIGNNCIIGFGSTVMKDVPSNSVVVGTPARVICTLDEFIAKREKVYKEQSFEYARSIAERFHRRPSPADFFESFTLFIDKNNIDEYPGMRQTLQRRLGPSFDQWLESNKAEYTFDEFLKAAGIE